MKSRIYKLLFLVFLLLNGSLSYSQILTVIAFYKNSNMDDPGRHVNLFSVVISGEIEDKSSFTSTMEIDEIFNDIDSRRDFFNCIEHEIFIKRKIVRYLTPFL